MQKENTPKDGATPEEKAKAAKALEDKYNAELDHELNDKTHPITPEFIARGELNVGDAPEKNPIGIDTLTNLQLLLKP